MPHKDKEKKRECDRQYYQAHRETKDAYARQWRLDHPGKGKEWSLAWRKANLDRERDVHRAWYETNREKARETARRWVAANLEKSRASDRQWRKTHPDRVRAIKQRRRAKEVGAMADLTVVQWNEILVQYDYRCAYCGAKFSKEVKATQDHVIPLSRGGHHTAANIVPACLHCNCSKGTKILSA